MSDLQVELIARAMYPEQPDGFQYTVQEIIEEIQRRAEDKARLDWLERNSDEVTSFRDIRKGLRVQVCFCYDNSGCPGAIQSNSLRSAVDLARKEIKRKVGIPRE